MKRPKHRFAISPALRRQPHPRFSKNWLNKVSLDKLRYFASSSSGSQWYSSVFVSDWGWSGVTPGSDGTPGYSIYQTPLHGQTYDRDGDGCFGWYCAVQWNMHWGYLNTLPCSSGGGVIGNIYQNVSCEGYDDENNFVWEHEGRFDTFPVYCTLTPIYHNGILLSYNRSYTIQHGVDLFCNPDTFITDEFYGSTYVNTWGEAWFEPVGSSMAGSYTYRWLNTEAWA